MERMNLLLTGGTGYIGSAVLAALLHDDHQVTALVRSASAAERVAAAGAVPLLGDITDADWLTGQLAEVDGAVHTASPGDATSAEVDRAVADAVIAAFAGTTKPHVHTSGVWVHGSSANVTEETPFAPPEMVAWRGAIEADLLAADVAATILEPAVVYGHGAGIPAMLARAPRTPAGDLTVIGDGSQHWATVHVDDLAELYVLVLEAEPAVRVIGASGHNPTVRSLAEAIADGPVVGEGAESSRERLGDLLADALLLDQQAPGSKARSLGWSPTRRTLLEEITAGDYRG